MKVYVDAVDYEVYTEKNIDEEITQRIKDDNYEGLLSYITDNFTEPEIFAMLLPNVQSKYLESYKKAIIEDEFYERKIDEPNCPLGKCPYAK